MTDWTWPSDSRQNSLVALLHLQMTCHTCCAVPLGSVPTGQALALALALEVEEEKLVLLANEEKEEEGHCLWKFQFLIESRDRNEISHLFSITLLRLLSINKSLASDLQTHKWISVTPRRRSL